MEACFGSKVTSSAGLTKLILSTIFFCCFELSVYLHYKVVRTETTTLLYPETCYKQGLSFHRPSENARGKVVSCSLSAL